MRTLLGLATVVSLASLAALRPAPTEACGYGVISVFRIATHRALEGGSRSFALVSKAETEPTTWRALPEGAYVMPLEVAAAPQRPARKLTLVGPEGTRIATSQLSVELSGPETQGKWMNALGLGDRAGFQFAVTGPAIGLKQEAFKVELAGDADAAWLAGKGIAVGTDVWIAHQGDLDILGSSKTDDPNAGTTVVRRKGELVTQAQGKAVGMLASDGTHYLLVEHDQVIQPVMLWD